MVAKRFVGASASSSQREQAGQRLSNGQDRLGRWWRACAWMRRVSLGPALLACGSGLSGEPSGNTSEALSVNDRTFRFEGTIGATGDWAVGPGIASSSSIAHSGSKSLSLGASGSWIPTVMSRATSTLGPINNSLKIWVRLPAGYICQAGGWCGQIAAFLSVPSRGINDLALTPAALAGPTGTWREYSLPLPNNVVNTLSTTTYTDLRVTLRVNGSAASNTVLLDDLSFGSEIGGPRFDPGEPEEEPMGPNELQATYDVLLPADLRPLRSALIGLEEVEIEAGAQVTDVDGFSGVTNLGPGLLRIGAGAKVGSILAKGNVQLGPNTHVYGDLLTQGSLDAQSGSTVDGTTDVGELVPTLRIPARIRFPKFPQPAVSLAMNQVRTVPLAPGRYTSLSLAAGAELPLVAGRYLFDSVTLEQGSRLKIRDTAGTVEVYAETTLNYRGRVLRDGGGQPDLVTTYFGTGTVSVTGPLRGTLIAPVGTVLLQDITGPVPIPEAVHRGLVFGKVIRVRGTLNAVPPDMKLFQCVSKPNGSPCADGNGCTLNDTCMNGVCRGLPKTCGPSTECMDRTACEPETGACGTVPQREGESCGNPADGTCVNGICATSGFGYPTQVTSYSKPYDDSELGPVTSEELQGIAHSDNYWFWVSKGAIQRVTRGESLISPFSGGVGIPSQFADYDHFGDPDFANGFLFATLSSEGGGALVVVYDEELQVRAWAMLHHEDTAWVSINPKDGRLYTSRPFDTLHVYNMSALLATAQGDTPAEATLTEIATVKIVLDDVRPTTCPEAVPVTCGRGGCSSPDAMRDLCKNFWSGVWVQGGDFSPNGVLYYVLDYKYADNSEYTGVLMVNVPAFNLPIPVPPEETPPAFVLPVAPDGHLNIEYDGVMDASTFPLIKQIVGGPARARELEGITIFRESEGADTSGLLIELINNLDDDDNATIHQFSTNE